MSIYTTNNPYVQWNTKAPVTATLKPSTISLNRHRTRYERSESCKTPCTSNIIHFVMIHYCPQPKLDLFSLSCFSLPGSHFWSHVKIILLVFPSLAWMSQVILVDIQVVILTDSQVRLLQPLTWIKPRLVLQQHRYKNFSCHLPTNLMSLNMGVPVWFLDAAS